VAAVADFFAAVLPEQDRPEVLAQLLDEVERDERESRKEVPRPEPSARPAPRPFAFD
jgi:hypothetical protein